MLSETILTNNDLQKIGRQIDFNVFLNTISKLEFRVVPLCLGEIVFSEIVFQKKPAAIEVGEK